MLYSGRTQMLSSRFSALEACSMFKEAGFDGVEICFDDINFNLRPDLADDRIIFLMRDHCAKLGLSISAVGNHMRYFFDEFVFAHIQKEIRATRKYGTDVFILSAMNDPGEMLLQNGLWETVVRRVRILCNVAESEGVSIALEPEPPSVIGSTGDFLRLCENIGSPSLCVNFDIGHAFLTDRDILDSIDLLQGKIRHCHIEDIMRGRHLHLLPGRGDIDLPAVMRKLRDTGYNGYLSLDLYNYSYEDVMACALLELRAMESA